MLERKLLFKCGVGSTLQNLRNKYSDFDEKIVVLPNFDDLFYCKLYGLDKVSKEKDESILDCRKLDNLFFNTSPMSLEILFSNNIIINDELNLKTKLLIKEIFENKEEIAKINLKALYYSTTNLIQSNFKLLEKKTPSKTYLFELYGYNTKIAMHLLRLQEILISYQMNNFSNMNDCIIYNNENNKFLLDVKNGKYSLQEIKEFYFSQQIKVDLIRYCYLTYPTNTIMSIKLKDSLKEIVKLELFI